MKGDVNAEMEDNLDSLILHCPCIYITTSGNYGALKISKEQIRFISSDFYDLDPFTLDYSDIEEITSQVNMAGAHNSIKIKTKNSNHYLFMGITNPKKVADLILLNKQQLESPLDVYGFLQDEDSAIVWKNLQNPTELCHLTIPSSMDKVRPLVEGKKIIEDYYASLGNEDIVVSEWTKCDGYAERRIDYMKLVIAPVIGKTLIKVAEFQKLFQIDDKTIGIHVESDLGKTPYADCFDPFVQVVYTDHGNSVEMVANLEIVWSSEPFVKGIIMSKTSEEVKITYTGLGKTYLKEFGADNDNNETKEDEENNKKETISFTTITRIHKIIIWLLIVILFLLSFFKLKPFLSIRYPIPAFFSFVFFIILFLFF